VGGGNGKILGGANGKKEVEKAASFGLVLDPSLENRRLEESCASKTSCGKGGGIFGEGESCKNDRRCKREGLR